jgi:hypothetical protein
MGHKGAKEKKRLVTHGGKGEKKISNTQGTRGAKEKKRLVTHRAQGGQRRKKD